MELNQVEVVPFAEQKTFHERIFRIMIRHEGRSYCTLRYTGVPGVEVYPGDLITVGQNPGTHGPFTYTLGKDDEETGVNRQIAHEDAVALQMSANTHRAIAVEARRSTADATEALPSAGRLSTNSRRRRQSAPGRRTPEGSGNLCRASAEVHISNVAATLWSTSNYSCWCSAQSASGSIWRASKWPF